jgi:Leu/Phe-tRNA-protein transferase
MTPKTYVPKSKAKSVETKFGNVLKLGFQVEALIAFAKQHGISWIDCQQNTKHLAFLGAQEIPQAAFLQAVDKAVTQTAPAWEFLPLYWKNIF